MITNKGLDFYVSLMERGTPFSFSRYGDGEISILLGKPKAIKGGREHEACPQAEDSLSESLERTDDNFFHALQPYALRIFKDKIPVKDWHNADVFHRASMSGELFPFVERLRKMPCVLVGPSYLQPIRSVLKIPLVGYVEVPQRNCFLFKESVLENMRPHITEGDVFLFSCGFLANYLIHKLHDGKNWYLDCGSVWDVYVGRNTRKYHKRMLRTSMERNLCGK